MNFVDCRLPVTRLAQSSEALVLYCLLTPNSKRREPFGRKDEPSDSAVPSQPGRSMPSPARTSMAVTPGVVANRRRISSGNKGREATVLAHAASCEALTSSGPTIRRSALSDSVEAPRLSRNRSTSLLRKRRNFVPVTRASGKTPILAQLRTVFSCTLRSFAVSRTLNISA